MTSDPAHEPALPAASWHVLRENRGWLLALGILWIVCGTAAIVLPHIATLAVTLLIGALLGAGGIVQIVQGVRCRGWRGIALHIAVGVLALIAGLILLFFPLQGALTLTLILGVFFVLAGILRTAMALQNRDMPGWGWMLASGILGIAVGLIVWLGWPGTALWVLGLLVGVELIFAGWAIVMIAMGVRRDAPAAG